MAHRPSQSRSLITRLLLHFAMLSVAPLLLVGWVSYHVSSTTLREESSRHARQILATQREYIDSQIEQIESLIANVSGIEAIFNAINTPDVGSNDYERLATQARIGYTLNGYLSIRGLVSIDILTMDGRLFHVGDTLSAGKPNQDVFDTLFKRARGASDHGGWIGVSANVNPNSRHKQVITAARVLTVFQRDSLEQLPVALLLVNFDIVDLHDRLRAMHGDADGVLMVLDDQGELVFHPEINRLGKPLAPALRDLAANAYGSRLAVVNNEETLITATDSVLTGWKIIGLIPVHSLEQKTVAIQRAALAALLCCALVMAATLYSLSKSVITPLRGITEGFKRLRVGQATAPLPYKSRDEVGELVAWFNTFLESWRERQESARQLAAAHDKLAAQATELARSNAELESFAYVASHDLRQPLRQIASYITLLDHRGRGRFDEEEQEFIKFARDGAKRMDKLIVSLLEYSCIGRRAQPRGLVDLSLVIADATHMLSMAVEDVGGTVTVAEGMPAVVGDQVELVRLFQNLIGNALKYHAPDRAPTVDIACRRDGDRWIVAVKDNGIGIDPQHFDRIFGIFQRLHANDEFEGTGIGLSVCKKIAEHHGGDLWVTSTPGRGSVFSIAFPVASASSI